MQLVSQLLACLLIGLERQLLPYEVEVLGTGSSRQLVIDIGKLVLELQFKRL